jgi:uncharacterized RDD family membrane protein YckC
LVDEIAKNYLEKENSMQDAQPLPVQPTPSHVPNPAPTVRYAGFWIRVAAYLLDIIILIVPLVLVVILASVLVTELDSQGFQNLDQTERTIRKSLGNDNDFLWNVTSSLPDCTQPNTGPKAVCESGRTHAIISGLAIAIPTQLLLCSYFIFFTASKMRGTIGKKVLGLQVVDEQGNQLSLSQSAKRYIFVLIGAVTTVLSGIVPAIDRVNGLVGAMNLAAVIMVAFDKRKQGLHDRIAKTFVIKTR